MTDRRPDVIACDCHPRYSTTGWAGRQGHRTVRVQHHHAHAASLLAEHGRLDTAMLAVVYDGTGYGSDGTVWGGELLMMSDPTQFARVGHLATFGLPGGDGAAREPARIALDLLHRAGVDWDPKLAPVVAVGSEAVRVLRQQIPRGIGCVTTSSMGRLFDAVASLLDVCQYVSYEGQAAVALEQVARRGSPVPLEITVRNGVLDPLPLIRGLVTGLESGEAVDDLAAGFHAALTRATVAAASACAAAAGVSTIGLTGGVFVNRLLRSAVRKGLERRGFDVLTHRIVPCNDGGLALGQAVVAAVTIADDAHERSSACASAFPAR
jgi:hydrogenase maturation protein HypF